MIHLFYHHFLFCATVKRSAVQIDSTVSFGGNISDFPYNFKAGLQFIKKGSRIVRGNGD